MEYAKSHVPTSMKQTSWHTWVTKTLLLLSTAPSNIFLGVVLVRHLENALGKVSSVTPLFGTSTRLEGKRSVTRQQLQQRACSGTPQPVLAQDTKFFSEAALATLGRAVERGRSWARLRALLCCHPFFLHAEITSHWARSKRWKSERWTPL